MEKRKKTLDREVEQQVVLKGGDGRVNIDGGVGVEGRNVVTDEVDGEGLGKLKKEEVKVSRTMYDGWWSHNLVVVICFIFAFGCFIYSVVMLF
jgi:hypothetical protein